LQFLRAISFICERLLALDLVGQDWLAGADGGFAMAPRFWQDRD